MTWRWLAVALAIASVLLVGVGGFSPQAEALSCEPGYEAVDTDGDGIDDSCQPLATCQAFWSLDYTGDGVADTGFTGCSPACPANGAMPVDLGTGVYDCTLTCAGASQIPADSTGDGYNDICITTDAAPIGCVALVGVVAIDVNLDGVVDACAPCSANNTLHYELVDATGDGVPNSCFEVFDCDSRIVTIWGTPGDDTLSGTEGPDVIHLLSGDDKVFSLGGDDVICGGGGRDRIYSGDGQDRIFGGLGIDYVWGGDDNDVLFGDGGSDRLKGGSGRDEIQGGSGADRIWGQGGDDTILGQGGQDQIWGGYGDDNITGNWQTDEIHGGPGRDTIFGNGGKDRLFGDEGEDTLLGGENTDTLEGGSGNDGLFGGRGTDTLRGGDGADLLDGGKHADTCIDVPATTTYVSCSSRGEPEAANFTLQVLAPTGITGGVRPFTDFEVSVTPVTFSYVTVAVAPLGGSVPASIIGKSCAELLAAHPEALSCSESQERRTAYGDPISVGFLDASGRVTFAAPDGAFQVQTEASFLDDPYCWWSLSELVEAGTTSLERELYAICA